ncbi:dTDP-glucose 4,6-dehydratase [Gilvibacter sediminis]|uniref:dTDP-glucose 4,6-dehydratase n=1 Tax=Gilvibacter sediminis TaxID=379071 RepID=UPI002350848A|nr:dTDP-glucose 4,6-dehydratase [Gilvibacter sediminis]MDC7996801.1 dTDP-glucose 4,6-dehydratase [Gilvibacter sediminis]
MPQKNRSILVTGGAGFIGSNYIKMLLEESDHQVVNLDKLTYAGDLRNLEFAKGNTNYHFVEGDICDSELIHDLFQEHRFDYVVHFAAESHVDNSITNPDAFVQTNVVGTHRLLHAAYTHWMDGPNQVKDTFTHARFLHVSTDEVYGTLGDEGLFTEETPYAPNSPYSASKAASDMLVRSYFHTYGFPAVTTNCSNNYGPHQHSEKLIPTIIRSAVSGKNIPIYGDGQNIRDWLYVADHCRGVHKALLTGRLGETYNIGGKNERNNLYIAKFICELLDEKAPREDGQSYKEQISFVTDRPGHDFRYAIDASKITTELGWEAQEHFESGMDKTLNWYLNHKNRLGL